MPRFGVDRFQAVDGSISAPAYTWLNDTDTGFYRQGANAFGAVSNGLEQFRITDGGFAFQKSTIVSAAVGTLTINAFTLGGAITGNAQNISGLGTIAGVSLQLSGLTASEILGTDASKNLVSLTVATYPSLTELSYVKGVSSAIQTQLNSIAGNLAYGLTPTATVWNVAPTTLTNLTDGNLTTVTGEGNRASTAVETNNLQEITIDLGAVKSVSRIVAKIGIRSQNAITTTARLRAGEADDLTDEQIGGDISTTSASEVVRYIQSSPTSQTALVRYINLRIWGAGDANLSYLKVYEVLVNG